MIELPKDRVQEKLDDMVDRLAGGEERLETFDALKGLQNRSKKVIGLASGGAIGSVVPGVGSLLGAIIGYSLADSRWVQNKVDQWLNR